MHSKPLFFSVTSLLYWGKDPLARPQASPNSSDGGWGTRGHLQLLLLWEFLC